MQNSFPRTRIQILANWPMSHAKRVTRDNRKNPEYHVVVPIRNLRTDTNCPAGKPWPNHVKKCAAIFSGSKKLRQHNWTVPHNDAKDRKRKCSIFVCGPLHHYVKINAE